MQSDLTSEFLQQAVRSLLRLFLVLANQLEQPFIRLYHRNVEIETVDHVAEVDQFRLLGRTLGGDGFALRAEFSVFSRLCGP